MAAALIFDAAPHMQYRREKKTRLEAAQEIGQWLLAQLPPESQIAVFDSGMAPRTFDADRGLSKQRIQRLEIVPNPRPLSRIIAEAAVVLKNSTLPAKEIYVFTDLSRASWRADETAQLQERLHELAGVSLYLIDVGVTDPSNFGLGDLHLSQQVVAAGDSVEIQTDVSCLGAEGQRVVELDLLAADGEPQTIDGQVVPEKNQRANRAAAARRDEDHRFPAPVAQAGHAAGAGADRGQGLAARPTTCATSASRSARLGPCWSWPSSRRRKRPST